jgi:hypothetical protein
VLDTFGFVSLFPPPFDLLFKLMLYTKRERERERVGERGRGIKREKQIK